MRIALALAAALALSAAGAAAEGTPPEMEDGRFIVRGIDDGLLRIDRETGATSVCRETVDGWICQAVPDDREALEDEIARLAAENAALTRRVGELEEQLAAIGNGVPPPRTDDSLPTDEELDRVMDTFERMMRRFLGIVRSLKEDFEADRL